MEYILSHCSVLISSDFPLFISVLLAGLLGSATHCSLMCAPLVSAQMLRLAQEKQPKHLLLYYHAGRISTYVMLGLVAYFASQLLFSGALYGFAQWLLVLAGALFIISALLPKKTHACCAHPSALAIRSRQMLSLKFVYFLRGILMGFMPCGLIVAVLLSVATLSSALLAAALMLVFGLATLPLLQIAATGALKFGRRFPQLSAPLSRSVLAVNGLFLCGLGLNIVSIH